MKLADNQFEQRASFLLISALPINGIQVGVKDRSDDQHFISFIDSEMAQANPSCRAWAAAGGIRFSVGQSRYRAGENPLCTGTSSFPVFLRQGVALLPEEGGSFRYPRLPLLPDNGPYRIFFSFGRKKIKIFYQKKQIH